MRGQQLGGVRPHDQLVVVGAVAARDEARALELVERPLLEADRERRDALARSAAAASAVSADESIPPDSRTPTGDVGDEVGAHASRAAARAASRASAARRLAPRARRRAGAGRA